MKLTGKDYLIGFLILAVIVSSVFTYKENSKVTKLKNENIALQVHVDESTAKFNKLQQTAVVLTDSLTKSKDKVQKGEIRIAKLEKDLKKKPVSPVASFTSNEMDSVFKELYPEPDSIDSKVYPAWVSVTQKQIFADLNQLPVYDSLVTAYKTLTTDYKKVISDQEFIIINQADQVAELRNTIGLKDQQLLNTEKQVTVLTVKSKRTGKLMKIVVPVAVIVGFYVGTQLK